VISSTASLFDDELDELSPAQQREYLRTITRSAERLAAMASDLLDLARLESGHLAIDPGSTDLAAVIAQAVPAAKAAADKQLTVTVETDHTLPLYADTDRLRQVADNLLGNAIKYTPAGGTISITAHPDGDDAITWTVADTGIGIPAAERPRLFRRFYRASTALQHRIPGTGLGLVVTRAIVERHHGSITLAEHHGPGTTFVIRLPTKPPA
jgi:signal transduction histidine kinase